MEDKISLISSQLDSYEEKLKKEDKKSLELKKKSNSLVMPLS
jgi:hypothetical protein